MSYTYTSFVTALALEMEVLATDANFLAALPQLIDDAEQRCYRDLDLLASVVTVTGTLTANNRAFTLPTGSGHILVVDSISVLDGTGTRHPLNPATKEVIDWLYPSNTAPSTPSYGKDFARADDLNVLIGPAPDSAYSAEVTATIRPTPLSASNTTTFLTSYLSDVFFAAAMVAGAGYQKNWGSQADDPNMAISWEGQYQARMASARTEELHKSYISQMSAPPASQKDA